MSTRDRQKRRRERLNQAAELTGFETIDQLTTAILRGEIIMDKIPNTWFNHTTNEFCVRGECSPDLAEAAKQIGYINRFNEPDKTVWDIMSEYPAPEGYHLTSDRTPPAVEAIRVGQYKVRSGDPDFSIYIVRD